MRALYRYRRCLTTPRRHLTPLGGYPTQRALATQARRPPGGAADGLCGRVGSAVGCWRGSIGDLAAAVRPLPWLAGIVGAMASCADSGRYRLETAPGAVPGATAQATPTMGAHDAQVALGARARHAHGPVLSHPHSTTPRIVAERGRRRKGENGFVPQKKLWREAGGAQGAAGRAAADAGCRVMGLLGIEPLC